MEDYIFQLRNFLPIEFTDIENEKYIQYLVDAYLKNIEAKTYQFAFISFHLLYMSFIYKTIWLLKKEKYGNVEILLGQIRDMPIIYSPFDFSVIEEAKIFQILRCLRFHQNEIEAFSLPVKNRNHCSHASGTVQYEKDDIEYLITKELQYSQNILLRTTSCLEGIFNNFTNDNWNPETRELISAKEATKDFIRQNLLSAKELELLIPICIDELSKASDNRKKVYIKALYLVFLAIIQQYIATEENLFLKYLPLFINGFDKQAEVSIEILINDEFSEILRDFNEKDKITFAQITRPHENIVDENKDIAIQEEHLKDSVSIAPHEAVSSQKKALLILAGGRTLPDILTLLYLQPQLVIVITPKEDWLSQRTFMDIASGLPFCEVRFVPDVDAYDIDTCMQACIKALLPYPQSEWNWFITTSSAGKIMSLVGYELAKQRSIPCLHVDALNRKVISLVKEIEVNSQSFFRLSIPEYMKSYGFVKTSYPSDLNYRSKIEKWHDIARELAASNETETILGLLRDKAADIKISLPLELMSSMLLSSLVKNGLLEVTRQNSENKITCNFTSNESAQFLSGEEWLTIYIWHELVQAGIVDDCEWGCLISNGSVEYQFDLAYTYRTRLTIAECSTKRNPMHRSDSLYRLDSNANLLGGRFVSRLFITSQPGFNGDKTFYKQAELRRIVVLTKENLPDIATILKKEMFNTTYPGI